MCIDNIYFLAKIVNWHDNRHQSIPKIIRILPDGFCPSDQNLMISPLTEDELWRGKAKIGGKFGFLVQFNIEGQG